MWATNGLTSALAFGRWKSRTSHRETRSRWGIVVVDVAEPDWTVSDDMREQRVPVQYCGLMGHTTMLQKALHRAGCCIRYAAHIMGTAEEVHRSYWKHAFGFMQPSFGSSASRQAALLI